MASGLVLFRIRAFQSPCNLRVLPFGGFVLLLLLTWLLAAPVSSHPQLVTYRPSDSKSTNDQGQFEFQAGETAELILFGSELTNDTMVIFSSVAVACDLGVLISGGNVDVPGNVNSTGGDYQQRQLQRASLTVLFSESSTGTFYFCLDGVHQGSEPWLVVVVKRSLLPLWAEIIFIIVLMCLSGLFSGLNLGLMALDPTTLKIITESGSRRQRTYAKLIYRVRRHGNYLLCTLLLGNVLVNSTLTILLDEVLPSGIYAVVASTLAIVIFGEIIPQAICSRHGLVVGAWTIPLTIFFMVLTFPLSMPLSLILNLVLGKEIGSVYNRDQLLKLLHVTREHHDLENDEVDVISGVLNYKKKMARDVMTNFDDIFCVSIDSVLDFKTMGEIYNSGYSRIPIYEDSKENIIHLLYVRDLAFVDPDDKTTVASHIQFYRHELLFFYEDTPLDDILKGFLEGKCHMGVVQAIKEVPDKDPVYVAVGVITLEDIVEEILQREIVDETDRFVDNRTFKPRLSHRTIDVNELTGKLTNSLTAQQRLAVYQFLSSEVEAFSMGYMSATVLKRLLTQKNIVQRLSMEEYKRKNRTIYSAGSPANFFCLVLEGCVQVVIGKDGLKFESRSFSYFGAQAMINARDPPPQEYIPDFTARPFSDCLLVVISQQQYMAARRASIFEEGRNSTSIAGAGGSSAGMDRLITPGGKTDVFNSEWAMADPHNLELNSRATPTTNNNSYPVDMLVANQPVAGMSPVGVGSFSVIAGRKSSPPLPPTSSRRRESDRQHLLQEEGSSSSDPDSPTAVRMLVAGGGGPSVMLTSLGESHLSPSHSSNSLNNDYKSTQV